LNVFITFPAKETKKQLCEMIKVFYYVILVILSLLAISDAKRRLSFENKDDERLMMTILEKRERQKGTIREVIHRHLREIDSKEEVM